MPRNLPWKRHRLTEPEPVLSAAVRTPSRPASVAPSPRPSASSKRSVSTPTARDVKAERTIRSLRSPSTSPPPEPLSETFMVDGLDDDDRFRMVEDELLYIAGKFTAHLHAAEYHRQKQQAKTRNADTIDSISRPVVGRMTPGVRAKQDRLTKTRRRKDGVRKALANGRGSVIDIESDDDESPWMGTSLQGLMEAPQGSAMRLSRLTSVGPSTKASARSSQAVHEAENGAPPRATYSGRNAHALMGNTTDDDNEPDVPIKRSTFPRFPSAKPSASTPTAQHARPRPPSTTTPQRQSTWPLKHGVSVQDTEAPASKSHKDERTIVPLLSDSDDDLFASLRKRRQESRAPRGGSRRGNPSPAPPSANSSANTATGQDRGKKAGATSDIIPSFL